MTRRWLINNLIPMVFGWILWASACTDPLQSDRVPVVQLATDSVSFAVGDSLRLHLLPILPPGYVPSAKWTSSDPVVVTVEKAGALVGTVKGVSPGQAVITVTGDGAGDSTVVIVTGSGNGAGVCDRVLGDPGVLTRRPAATFVTAGLSIGTPGWGCGGPWPSSPVSRVSPKAIPRSPSPLGSNLRFSSGRINKKTRSDFRHCGPINRDARMCLRAQVGRPLESHGNTTVE